jgi:4-amino-4-deoxy-L-arabinose transferase-like glycosyltransferase
MGILRSLHSLRSLRWQFWRSPDGQPSWARPLLLLIAALAGLGYGWGIAHASVDTFYGAAARSMSQSWHDFIFGAFDPDGTITVDKLPGALWVQALSLRIFGFHIWAIVLPQVAEGVLTVLVLYRAVRRLAGPVAGLAAAAVLAVTPVTVLLGRGNVSDALLMLLLVLAADAVAAAITDGRLRWLLLAGVWVGLAFQAKMVQAWLVLPALAAAYLLAAPAERLRTRIGHVTVAGVITVLVSLSWMTVVSLVPAHDRPYVDGSPNDSVYQQVFEYNGLARLGGHPLTSAAGPPATFLVTLLQEQQSINFASASFHPSWHRLLSGPIGRDGSWLLPAALLGAIAVLSKRRTNSGEQDHSEQDHTERRGRRDPLRAAVVLWGGWWVTLAVFFSAGSYLNSYYVAALSPAVAALCGAGLSICGPPPWPVRVRLTMLAAVAACGVYGLYLLRGTSVLPGWIVPVALISLMVAAALLLLGPWLAPLRYGQWLAPAVACLSLLALPASASASSITRGLGPFDTPFESAQISTVTRAAANSAGVVTFMQRLARMQPGVRILLATDTSAQASSFILFSGQEVLPIGGYLGGAPVPTLATLRSDVSNGTLHMFLLPVVPATQDPRVRWVEATCGLLQLGKPLPGSIVQFGMYSCGGPTPQPVNQPAPVPVSTKAP